MSRNDPFPIMYKDLKLDAYRADLIVAGLVVVELKSVETLLPVHEAQLLTHLRLTNCPVGLFLSVPRMIRSTAPTR